MTAAPKSRLRRTGLRKTRTILENGVLGHGLLRFVHLDPPGLIKVQEDDGVRLVCSLSGDRSAFDDDTGGHIFSKRDAQLLRQPHNSRLPQAAAITATTLLNKKRGRRGRRVSRP